MGKKKDGNKYVVFVDHEIHCGDHGDFSKEAVEDELDHLVNVEEVDVDEIRVAKFIDLEIIKKDVIIKIKN